MENGRDLTEALARQVRAAVAETSSAAGRSEKRLGEPSGLEEVRVPLERAEAYLTPAIPDGAPLSGFKKLLLRAFKFLWRDQSSFNALSLEAMLGLRQGILEARSAVEGLRREIDDVREEIRRWNEELARWSASFDRRLIIQDGRFSLIERAQAPAPEGGEAPSGPGAPTGAEALHAQVRSEALPAGVYSLFEERFRGAPEQIGATQSFYLPFLMELPGLVLDVGCGRGELLRLLRERGIPACGIETNAISAEACRREGLDVLHGDALEVLARTEAGRFGAVVALQVVEHWSAETTFAFLRETRRVLTPGGRLILETINTDSLSALRAFYLDPTHVRPVPPETLRFLAEAAGFVETRIEYRAALPEEERLTERSENDARLNRLLFAPQDYALLARAPEKPA